MSMWQAAQRKHCSGYFDLCMCAQGSHGVCGRRAQGPSAKNGRGRAPRMKEQKPQRGHRVYAEAPALQLSHYSCDVEAIVELMTARLRENAAHVAICS